MGARRRAAFWAHVADAKKARGCELFFGRLKRFIDPLRIVTLDVPPQDIITKDNVSVKVNAVCYFKVVDANRACVKLKYFVRTSQLAQTTLRSVVGQFQLDEILSERDRVNEKLQLILDQDTEAWESK